METKSAPKFNVGDKAVVCGNSSPVVVTVVSAGRKLCQVTREGGTFPMQVKFNIHTGASNSEQVYRYLITMEEHEASVRSAKAREELGDLGILLDRNYKTDPRLTPEAILAAIKTILV